MTKSLIALSIALVLPSAVAFAEPQAIIPPAEQLSTAPGQEQEATKSNSFSAFRQNINGNVAVPTTGVYDQSDAFTGPRGFPLEGWSQLRDPGPVN
jgi:hypothetical protein